METRTRWTILWFLVLISVVRSMDAVNFSVAAKQIMPEYGFTNVQMGMLYTVFTAGYALFHIPGGWLARHGRTPSHFDARDSLVVGLYCAYRCRWRMVAC